MDEDIKLTLVEHLGELRKRIMIMAIATIIGALLSFRYIDLIIDYMIKPAGKLEFIYLSPPELFMAQVKIAIVCGMVITSPINFMQIWLFVKPGLKKDERKYLLFALYMGIVFFLLGAVFAYFTIIPITIDFFTQMSGEKISPLFSFESYLSFVSSLLLSFGLVFELPMIVVLLTQLNLVSSKTFKKHRKIVILGIFVVAAILTPPDVVSQILMALPMVVLYEFSIVKTKKIRLYVDML